MLSIIIPVYNIQQHIGKCLESVMSQTYKDVEIIVVNDGSSDESQKIIDKYQVLDSRIKVISQSNQGLGAARNAGLCVAERKYVLFVDGDDWLDCDVCEKIITRAENNGADIVVFGLMLSRHGSNKQRKQFAFPNYLSGENYLLASMGQGGFSPTVCNKLFKRELILDIEFPVAIKNEDIYFTISSLSSAKKVCCELSSFYHYNIGREGSITSNLSIECFNDIISIYGKVYSYLYKNGKKNIWKNKVFKNNIAERFNNEIIIKLFDGTKLSDEKLISRKLRNSNWYRSVSRPYILSGPSFKHKFIIFSFLYFPFNLLLLKLLFRVKIRAFG